MRRVALIGDSIRISYQDSVRSELADVAFVLSPAENGQHSTNLLMNLWQWVVAQQPDVVHMNAGLWDTRRVVPSAESRNVVPLDVYRQNVRDLISLTQKYTHAKFIWATTTPVHEANALITHRKSGLAGRRGSDVALYNASAVEIARELGATVNDLHQVVIEAGVDTVLSADGVHFTDAGAKLLGARVAEVIRRHL